MMFLQEDKPYHHGKVKRLLSRAGTRHSPRQLLLSLGERLIGLVNDLDVYSACVAPTASL